MRVVVAPDSFKGSCTALEAAEALADGWSRVRSGDDLRLIPQADGGEGTIAAIASSVSGTRLVDAAMLSGPDGRSVQGHWLLLPDGTAVVESALAIGLPMMSELDARGATSRGVGELIAAALDAGAPRVIVGLGGTATTDGGAGALRALGLVITDAAGSSLAEGGVALRELAHVDPRALRSAPRGGIHLLTDVSAPLLGAQGAAALFGPQKGASPSDVSDLEAGLRRFAEALGDQFVGRPGAGAGGGLGFGLMTGMSASAESGASVIAHLTGLHDAVHGADLVISGEGRFDRSSRVGKVVGSLLELCESNGVRAAVVAGHFAERPFGAGSPWEIGLDELSGSIEGSMGDPRRWLREAGALLAGRAELVGSD